MSLRDANLNDIPAIVELWDSTDLLVPWNDPASDIKNALATPTCTVLVHEMSDQLVGTVMVGYDGHRGWVYYLAVRSDYQGLGIGTSLALAAKDWLISHGVGKMQLMIRKDNLAVAGFYRRLGFQASEVTVMQKVIQPSPTIASNWIKPI